MYVCQSKCSGRVYYVRCVWLVCSCGRRTIGIGKERTVKGTVEDVVKDRDGQRYVVYYQKHDMTVRAVTPRYKENEKYGVGDSVRVVPFVDSMGEQKARVVDEKLKQLHNRKKTERVALIVRL